MGKVMKDYQQKCGKCQGCGKIANDEEGSPWSLWESLPWPSAVAVTTGLVHPVDCPDCKGTGKGQPEPGPNREEVLRRDFLRMEELDRNPHEQEALVIEVEAWCRMLQEELTERGKLRQRNARLVHKVRDLLGRHAPVVDRKPYDESRYEGEGGEAENCS